MPEKKPEFVPRIPSYKEYMAWVDQIVEEQGGWQIGVNGITGRELEAYQAGLQQGMTKLLATFRFQGVLPHV